MKIHGDIFTTYRWDTEDYYLYSQGRNGLAKTTGVELYVENGDSEDHPVLVQLTPITGKGGLQNGYVKIPAEDFTRICREWLARVEEN